MLSFRQFLDAPNGTERRAQRRFRTVSATPLTIVVAGQSRDCQVENFSLGGVLIRCKDSIDPDTTIEIEHPVFGLLPGACLWTEGKVGGVAFHKAEDPIHLCAYWLKQMVPEPQVT